jgi:ABC-2 type transport system ATP-binding protein
VSFEVPCGTVQVLLGPNGSGKTTLLKLISTMLLPDAGTVLVEEFDTRLEERAVRRRLGFAIANERSFFPRLTARENLEFFAAFDEVPRREREARALDLLSTVGLLEHTEKLVMNFSGGMYQRLGIARALLKSPSIVLMDEPSRSLDPGSAAQLWQLIRELAGRGTTVLVASHNFQETIAVADRVAVLCRGRLCGECRVSAASSTEWLREFYFDCVGDNDDSDAFFATDTMARALAG